MAMSQTHFRSISLPSRLDHQIKPKNFESQLEKLKSCSTSSQSIQSGLLGLAELYNSVEEFTQKSTDAKSMEESLSHSIDLLDACTAVRELLQTIRENVHSLQSALRRKGLDSGIQNDVAAYFCFRKKTQKTIANTLKSLKKSETVTIKNNVDAADNSIIFSQLTGVTISILKSVLVFISPSSIGGGGGSWSLVSKLMAAKSGKESGVVNEVGNMDLALISLQGKMRSDGARVLDLQKILQIVDDVVEEFEGGLERLFRQLVQSRVTLLNILTDY